MKSFFYSILEIAEIILVAGIAVIVIRNFLIQPFLVSGASMEPNFSSGDYLLINKLSYRFREPQRGEIVVFRYPGNEATFYIKRIIGLPGERLIITDGEITVFNDKYPEGFILKENYLPTATKTSGQEEIVLKDDEYFVLGDNRYYSFDSRNWGSLQKTEIVGLVSLRLWPINKVIAVEKPVY